MDTRRKIVDLPEAARIAAGLREKGARLKLIAAYFDVLTPDHARRFRALGDGQPMMVAVLDPPDPLLAPRARAELAAALAVVDYVLLLEDSTLEQALEQIRPDEVIREEIADRRRSQALIEHVHRRQRG
jgi:bifunctional ADP-heptose synthase (sugar kinase/adenylyltransferase)